MKRIGNLYEDVVSYDNIRKAMLDASKTKRSQKRVQEVLRNSDFYAAIIRDNFHISGIYKEKVHIDESSGKTRILEIPPYFPDQIIHHALVDVTYPYIRKKYINQTCCSVKGRGTLYASMIVRKYIRSGARYFVKFDIKKYFPNIDHEILKELLRKIIKDKKVLELYDEIIDSVRCGIPIGNYTSQPLANLYLTPLDRFIKETLKVRYYVRYMDDFIIMGENKKKLCRLIEPIKEYIRDNLKLKTHDNEHVDTISYLDKKGKRHGSPIDFCGFRHYADHSTIRRRIYKRLRRSLLRQSARPSVQRAKRLMCYYGYLKHSDSSIAERRASEAIAVSKKLLKKENTKWKK